MEYDPIPDDRPEDPDATLPYSEPSSSGSGGAGSGERSPAAPGAEAAPGGETGGGDGASSSADGGDDGDGSGGGSDDGGRGSLLAAVRSRRWLLWSLPAAAALVLGALAGVAVAAVINMPRVETLTDFTPGLITELHARDGDTFATFARQRRILLDESEVPELLTRALVAVEDANFFQHGGIDAPAVVRAQLANLRAGEIEEGASTLTMQLAVELFLTREQTWRRKIEQALLAVELEKRLTKQQILTMYMNLVNVGHGNYGFASAARYYFDKDVSDLELHEAAMLAGIVQLPSRLSPYRRPDLVKARRDKVLRRMLAEGFIDRQAYEAAKAEPLGVVSHAPDVAFAPYFAEELRQDLESAYSTNSVHDGGLQVWTTLDTDIQRAAEEALQQGLLELDHDRGWRGAPATVGDEDPDTWELPAWADQPLLPGRWVQGIVIEAGVRTARVRVRDQVYELDREGIAWTGRRRPRDLLSRGDVAWFRLLAPEGGNEESAGESAGAAEGAATEPPSADGDGEAPDNGAATVDPAALRIELEQPPEVQGAAVVLESATGAVRAMVGGWDFERSKFNRVTQARRQVGSAFKAFVYGAALEAGYTPADTLFDGPTGFVGADQEVSYWPRNHSRRHYGVVTLRWALDHSVNVPAVKLMDMVGVERTIDFARRCGVDSELPPYPSLALGAAEISPLEMATAYAAIANQGTWVEPYTVERVVSAAGQELERHAPITRTATDPRIAYVLNHMLQGVVENGTGVAVRDLPLDLAGKTGTTDDYTDAWFVGFTPRYTVLTWVGYDVKRSLGRGMTGARAALPIWRQILETGLEDGWLREDERFTPPPGVEFETVEYHTGLLPGAATVADEAGGLVEMAFLRGTEPVQSSTGRVALVQSLPWYQQRPFYIPKEGENMTLHVPGQPIDDEDDEVASVH